MRRYGHTMRNLVDDVELLYRDLIDLVQDVDARYIDSVAFNDVDQIIHAGVASYDYVSIVDAILAENRFHSLQVQIAVHGTLMFLYTFSITCIWYSV